MENRERKSGSVISFILLWIIIGAPFSLLPHSIHNVERHAGEFMLMLSTLSYLLLPVTEFMSLSIRDESDKTIRNVHLTIWIGSTIWVWYAAG